MIQIVFLGNYQCKEFKPPKKQSKMVFGCGIVVVTVLELFTLYKYSWWDEILQTTWDLRKPCIKWDTPLWTSNSTFQFQPVSTAKDLLNLARHANEVIGK